MSKNIKIFQKRIKTNDRSHNFISDISTTISTMKIFFFQSTENKLFLVCQVRYLSMASLGSLLEDCICIVRTEEHLHRGRDGGWD